MVVIRFDTFLNTFTLIFLGLFMCQIATTKMQISLCLWITIIWIDVVQCWMICLSMIPHFSPCGSFREATMSRSCRWSYFHCFINGITEFLIFLYICSSSFNLFQITLISLSQQKWKDCPTCHHSKIQSIHRHISRM